MGRKIETNPACLHRCSIARGIAESTSSVSFEVGGHPKAGATPLLLDVPGHLCLLFQSLVCGQTGKTLSSEKVGMGLFTCDRSMMALLLDRIDRTPNDTATKSRYKNTKKQKKAQCAWGSRSAATTDKTVSASPRVFSQRRVRFAVA